MDCNLRADNRIDGEGMTQGVNEWRNIQDVVRLTFRALNDLVKVISSSFRTLLCHVSRHFFQSQASTIHDLEKAMQDRPTRAEVEVVIAMFGSVFYPPFSSIISQDTCVGRSTIARYCWVQSY
jgi:hypothetical protein